jgi:hypothetical protein
MKVYISGKMTGKTAGERVIDFMRASNYIRDLGHIPLNPIRLPRGLDYEDYMKICFAMIEVADAIALLPDWKDSPGARRELERAIALGKLDMLIPLRVVQEGNP